MVAMTRLNRICRCNTISFTSKFKLYKSLVISILLCGCETWTLLADFEKRIKAFKTKCLKTFSSSPTWSTKSTTGCGARSTPLWVHGNLFWQLSRDGNLHPWFTHVTCHISLSKTMLQGMYLGGWAAPWSAEEMLIVQHRRVDIPSHARTAHKGLLLKRLEEDLC